MHNQTLRQLGLSLVMMFACTKAAFAPPTWLPGTEAPPDRETSTPGPVHPKPPVHPHGGGSGGSEPLPQSKSTPMLVQPRWVLRDDALPSIAPNSEILLFVHGMDSRAEEADDITKALFSVFSKSSPQAPEPLTLRIAFNNSTVSFQSPEPCDHPDDISTGRRVAVVPFDTTNGTKTPLYFVPDLPPGYEGIPRDMLDSPPPPGTQFNVPAAHNLGSNEGRVTAELRAAAAKADPLNSLTLAATSFASGPGVTQGIMGIAYADLSVTGRRSFAAFRQIRPNDTFCQGLKARYSNKNVLEGCRMALDRAYRVANFLRTGERGDTPALEAAKTKERNALGWITVSGEDDAPHRPVNVPSSDYPQYDLTVVVPSFVNPYPGVTVHTRYTIAQAQAADGRNLVVISVDLPSSGYADHLNYNVVSPLSLIGTPVPGDFQASGMTPLLDFIENFIVKFVDTLDQQVPIKGNIKAVMGGSLGGNMTFRLGRRTGVPWLPKFIVWSPASIWPSLSGGSNLILHAGVAAAWNRANNAMFGANDSDRAPFFSGAFDQSVIPGLIPAQSEQWTSDYYQCKASSVAGARLDRQETYDLSFLSWRWRLATEQLIFSHGEPQNQPLFLDNIKPMLLACGLEDNFTGTMICPFTMAIASKMVNTPGRAVFLGQTGHSLDNERRNYWAGQIITFLGL